MEQSDLVFLRFGQNVCYTEVVDRLPGDVKVNLREKTWERKGNTDPRSRRPIGTGGHMLWGKIPSTTFGVFNRRDTEHLNALTRTAQEVVACHHCDED